jgi:hypothetical protein
MCGTLLHVVTAVVGKKNYNKGREIVLAVRQQSWSFQKAGLSGRLDQQENYS